MVLKYNHMNRSAEVGYMETRLRERFAGLVKYAVDTRGEHVVYLPAKPLSFVKWRNARGDVCIKSAHEAACAIMAECLDEMEAFFNAQLDAGRAADEEFVRMSSRFIADVSAPVGRFWPRATWLDQWDDVFQRDNQARKSMADDLLGALIARSRA